MKIHAFLLGIVLMLSVVPAFAQDNAQNDAPILPAPTGDYPVGRTIYQWTDESRDETHSEAADDKRTLMVYVWYPAAPAPDAEPALLYMPTLSETLQQIAGIALPTPHTYSYADAPAADGQFPVLLFSHGSGSIASIYTALLENIASHGYIVVSIEHPYNAMISVMEDGSVIFGGMTPDDAEIVTWVDDTTFVLEQLETLDGEALNSAHFDLTRIGVFGHSLGGAVAAEFCLDDDRCDAAINYDGSLWNDALAGAQLQQPFMQVFSDHPTCAEVLEQNPDWGVTVEECEAMFADQIAAMTNVYGGVGYAVTIAGASHNTFADNIFLKALIPDLDDGATIDAGRSLTLISDYTLEFFDAALNGDGSGLFEDNSAYPEVTVERYNS